MTQRLNRVVLFFIGTCVLLLSASQSQASIQYGLTTTVYDNLGYNNAPPLPPTTPIAGVTVLADVNRSFDNEPLFEMYEDFIVKYEGFITAPCTCPVEFMVQADDGTKLYLDGELITEDWYDKGGGGSVSAPVQFQENTSKEFLLWFYENGGGAWIQLWWMVNNQWEIVPATAFSQSASTTTEATTTTSTQPTTTTQEPATTTSVAETVPPAVETSTIAPQTTTTSSTFSTSTTVVSTTSTTQSTLPLTTTTLLLPVPTSTTTVVEQPVNVVDLTPTEAVELAVNKEAIAEATPEQAEEIFASIDETELTPELGAEIVAAVQDAPIEIREAFEQEIDIFAGNTDTYVPVGSVIPVSQRRSLIAVTAVMSVAPLASRRKW